MRTLLSTIACAVVVSATAAPVQAQNDIVLGPHAWRIIPRESGKVNYYSVVDDPSGAFIRARYVPPMETSVLGVQVHDGDKHSVKKVHWRWRAMTLPKGGDECTSGRGDSAAVVYVTWKRGLRYHTLKYVWSAVGAKGRVCDRKRNPFLAQDTVVLESGAPLGEWRDEEIDLAAEYQRHFGDSDVPDLEGLGIMTDGDQTRSESAADYGTFTFVR
jgi:hypothetical protein